MIKVWASKEAVLAATKSLRIKGWLNGEFNVWVPGTIGRVLPSYARYEKVMVVFHPPPPSGSITLPMPVEAIMLDRTWTQRHLSTIPLCRWKQIKELLAGKDADRWLESVEIK